MLKQILEGSGKKVKGTNISIEITETTEEYTEYTFKHKGTSVGSRRIPNKAVKNWDWGYNPFVVFDDEAFGEAMDDLINTVYKTS